MFARPDEEIQKAEAATRCLWTPVAGIGDRVETNWEAFRTESAMKIGELAAKPKVNVQTVRFYEREGLLRKPARTPGGYRTYEQQDLDRVMFIRVCQSLGFTLKEVEQLGQLHRFSTLPHSKTIRPGAVQKIICLAEQRIASIEQKIEALDHMRTDLRRLVTALGDSQLAERPAPRSSR